MTKPRARARGYALLFVLMLMIALGIVVGGLLTVLAQSVATSRTAHEDVQQMYGCDGAVRLALADADRHTGDVDNTRLAADLGRLRDALATDINPRTRRPYADLSSILVVPATRLVQIASTLPFMGMQFVEESNRITVAADTTGGRGRACQADAPNRRRTMSYFQFALASTDVVANPAGTLATAGASGDIFLLTHSMPGVARRATTPLGGDTVLQHVNLSGGDIYRPTPPSGQPWRFVNKSKRLGGLLGKKRKKKARRPTLEAFLKYPTDLGGIPDPTMSRFVKGADIRIIDGDWFIPDAAGNFPGRRIWSDQPLHASSATGLTYSAYERDDDGDSRGGAAIIRYGLVRFAAGAGGLLTAKPVVRGFCADAATFAPVNNVADAVTGSRVDCGAAGLALEPPAAEPDPFRAAAWRGFTDPTDDTPILPIVVDVGALIASLVTRGAGDLGEARCVGEEADCPVDKRFKGSIWIGTLAGGSMPDGTPRVPCPLINHPAPSTAPAGGLGCARPNAVVLYNMHDLNPFVDEGGNGLSIGSNLPMYVVGDVNSAAGASTDARIALLAPQITALSRDVDLSAVAWGAAGSIATSNARLEWNASLFTSWAMNGTAQRDPSDHVLRQLEDNVEVRLTGSVVTMFTAGQYLSKTDFNKSKGSYSSNPDPAVSGLPVFADDVTHLAAGTVRFPATGTGDLRLSEIEHQPPNAPRLSVDLQPLDKR